jgi:ATP/ADP translocase
VQLQLRKMEGMWHKFVPMVVLFFCMAFINTIVDSLKDTIIVTAPGSGPHVIPFLTGKCASGCRGMLCLGRKQNCP